MWNAPGVLCVEAKGYQAIIAGVPPEERREAILKALPRKSAEEIEEVWNTGRDPLTVLG